MGRGRGVGRESSGTYCLCDVSSCLKIWDQIGSDQIQLNWNEWNVTPEIERVRMLKSLIRIHTRWSAFDLNQLNPFPSQEQQASECIGMTVELLSHSVTHVLYISAHVFFFQLEVEELLHHCLFTMMMMMMKSNRMRR